MGMETFGRIAFYIGLVVSIVAGWVQIGGTGVAVLAVLGIVVGLLNVTGKETGRFLLATVSLVIAGVALREIFGAAVANILTAYIAFTAASALVVALKEVYSIQKMK